MKISRNVVIDLLPLYVAGEASADTRALVDEFLREEPDLLRQALEAGIEPTGGAGSWQPNVPPDVEVRSLRRAHNLLRWQRLTYAWAIALTCLALSTAIWMEGGQVHLRMLLVQYPSLWIPCVTMATSAWVSYLVLRRRARVTRP